MHYFHQDVLLIDTLWVQNKSMKNPMSTNEIDWVKRGAAVYFIFYVYTKYNTKSASSVSKLKIAVSISCCRCRCRCRCHCRCRCRCHRRSSNRRRETRSHEINNVDWKEMQSFCKFYFLQHLVRVLVLLLLLLVVTSVHFYFHEAV